MAKDIKLEFDSETLEGDVLLDKGDLETDEGLSTAVMISLFTDRRAEESDPYDNDDRRGWWGDQLALVEGDQIGSRLWLLNRSKATESNANKAKEYIYEALEWMRDDGVASDIIIDTFIYGDSWNKRLGCEIKIYRKSGNVIAMKFDDLWNKTPIIGAINAI